jgi:hypothetical protein
MSEMIKRCVEAIDWEWARHDPEATVRAIIAAMREPTEAMLSAPFHALVYVDDCRMAPGEAGEAWAAMIGEALR